MMLPSLPGYVAWVFAATVGAALVLLYRLLASTQGPNPARLAGRVLLVAMMWMAIQATLSLRGVYQDVTPPPPRLVVFGILPGLVLLMTALRSAAGQRMVRQVHLQSLVWFSVLRVPVEVVLFWLYQAGAIPQAMTFEGRNWDILAGLTAPLVAWLAFRQRQPNRTLLFAWHVLGLALLLNIIVTALLSAPTRWQQWGLEQPNIGLGYFPFVWLPTLIVPLVLASHVVSLRRLLRGRLLPE